MTVEPLTAQFGTGTVYLRRRFCACAAGQAKRTADELAFAARTRREKEYELTQSLNGADYGAYRFSTWDDGLNPGAKAVREQVAWFTDAVKKGAPNWLYLFGGYGLGKTHLAIAALRKLAGTRLWQPHVVVWPELCDATRESWSASFGESEAALWGATRSAEVLLIDDLDKTSTGQWAMGKLFGLINYRALRKKVTIITANRSVAHLRETWSAGKVPHLRDTGLSVLSRIEGQLLSSIRFTGEDQRRKK